MNKLCHYCDKKADYKAFRAFSFWGETGNPVMEIVLYCKDHRSDAVDWTIELPDGVLWFNMEMDISI
jgi:hypothetical protein